MMNRQYDLDWIRVLATLAVFIYHCFMFFNPWAWHVKNMRLTRLTSQPFHYL
ncbi:hypothetical protein P5G62_007715 [Neobacillus sp. 179-C4.2 HS]|uniref:Acyltransferase n=1 Tax=Neobacillus driksii TaxID=3035913 RepID=A0ABV4YQ71_9BACI|nr:hypothetical protein [Neobacillus sp. 179.-C4.2 HS]MDP5196864.1 hypothetical protein [Neobacillus sp. 179.-C4.2 HS]